MVKVRNVGRFIREQRNADRLSLRKLASLAGVSNPYLSQIERGLRRPSAEILNGIAKALRISSETLYIQAGILDERKGSDDVVEAVRSDRSITDRQRETLIQIYSSFRADTERRRARRKPRSTAAAAPRASSTGGRVESAG